MAQTIELDCAPFTPRPSERIGFVLKGSGFKVEDFDTGNPFFGHQVWTLKDPNRENEFIGKKPLFKERVTELYNSGAIRYGSW